MAGIGQREGKSKGNAPGRGGGRREKRIDLSDESMYLYVGYNKRERMLPSPRLASQKQNGERMSRCVAEHAAADAKDGKMMPNRRVNDGTDSRSTAWCTGERLYAYLSYRARRRVGGERLWGGGTLECKPRRSVVDFRLTHTRLARESHPLHVPCGCPSDQRTSGARPKREVRVRPDEISWEYRVRLYGGGLVVVLPAVAKGSLAVTSRESVWVQSTWHSPALGLAGASQSLSHITKEPSLAMWWR